MRFGRVIAAVLLATAALTTSVEAQGYSAPTWRKKNLRFQTAAPNPAVTAHGYYVGPFTGTVLSDPTRPTINLFCVDVLNQIQWGKTWTGVFTRLTSNDLGATRHGDAKKSQYEKAAFLASTFRAPGIGTNQWGGIQTAIWNLLNPGNPNGGTNPLANTSEAYWLAQAETWYTNGGATTFDFSRWSIVTAEGAAGRIQGGGTQEFLTDTTATPEPETWILLGTGVLAIFGFAVTRGSIRV